MNKSINIIGTAILALTVAAIIYLFAFHGNGNFIANIAIK